MNRVEVRRVENISAYQVQEAQLEVQLEETELFVHWWRKQSDSRRYQVHRAIEEGRPVLDFNTA